MIGKKRKKYKKKHKKKQSIEVTRYKAKVNRLKTLYRITPEEESAIEEFEKKHPVYKHLLGKNHATDHCHKTGLVRGRLDWLINKACGILERTCSDRLGDMPKVLHALSLYYSKPPAVTVLGEKRYGLMGKAKYKRRMIYGPPPGIEIKRGKVVERKRRGIDKKKKRKRKIDAD